jgi:hypothetical protein
LNNGPSPASGRVFEKESQKGEVDSDIEIRPTFSMSASATIARLCLSAS